MPRRMPRFDLELSAVAQMAGEIVAAGERARLNNPDDWTVKRIEPYQLWLGHAGDGRDIARLVDTGIEAVVQLAAEELPIALPRELVKLRFPLLDGPVNTLP